MPTTVADADIALHMDARPLVAELQRKLGPILNRLTKKNKLELNVDDRYLYRSGQKATKKLQKVLDSIQPFKTAGVELEKSLFSTSLRSAAARFFRDTGKFAKKVTIPVELESNDRLKESIKRLGRNLVNRVRLRIPVTLEAATRDLFDFRSGEGAISRFSKGFSSAGQSAAKFFRSVGSGFSTAFSAAKSFGEKTGETLGVVFSVMSKLAGPAISAVVVLVGVKLVGALITATALVGGLGAGFAAAFAIAGSAAAVSGLAVLPPILKIFKAVQGGNKEINKLPKGLQVGARAVVGLKNAFESWTKPFEPFVGKMVAQFANLGTSILPRLTPIVNEMGKAFVFLGERAEKAINGPTFTNFLNTLEKRGPAVFNHLTGAAANFGAGITNVLNTISPFAEGLSAKIEQISQKFRDWTVSAEGQKDIREFFQWVKDNAPAFATGVKDIGDKLLKLGKDLASEDIGKDLKSIGDGISAIAAAINGLNWALDNAKANLQLIKDLLSGKTFSDKNKGKKEGGFFDWLKSPFKGLRGGAQFGGDGGGMDMSGIVDSARLAFREVGQVASEAWRDISVGASGLAEDVGAGLAPLGSKMSSATSTAVNQVQGLLSGGKSKWTGTVQSATESAYWAWAPIAPRMGQVAMSAAGQASSGLWAGVGWVGSAADAMKDRVDSAASDMADGMFDHGAQVGEMVAAGIRSSTPAAVAAAENMADRISQYHPGSPVRKGPLKALNRGHAGRLIGTMLADGIESSAEPLGKALTRTMSIPAGIATGQRANNDRGVSKTTTITKSPSFTVMSPSKDPMAVAEAALRRGRLVGAF